MTKQQVYTFLNEALTETIGEANVLTEDLTNIVDMGDEVFNANAVDAYCKAIINKVGKTVFNDRKYSGRAPQLMRDAWEYGSILEKIRIELPESSENESWELQNGAVYSNEMFYQPSVSAKFFNKGITFEVDMSFTDKQIKQSFANATSANSFLSAIQTAIDNRLTLDFDNLIMRTINNMTAETINDEATTLGQNYANGSGVRAVNLLYLYNQTIPEADALTASEAITDAGFLKFAGYTMGLYADNMTTMSTLFNMGGTNKFTSADNRRVVMLSPFYRAVSVYLQSDTFHDELVSVNALNADVVPYWQGSGTDFAFGNVSKIDVKTSEGNSVSVGGVLAVMFDKDACAVANVDRRVTMSVNAKAEFRNSYYKADAQYMNDANENFVVFFVA